MLYRSLKTLRPPALLLILAFAVAHALVPTATIAQPTFPEGSGGADMWVSLQDTLWIWRMGPNNTPEPRDAFAPEHSFTMNYDSVCETRYLFTECKINGTLWKLAKWWDGRTVNANADLLSYNTRTVPKQLQAGDTISFFRYLHWRNPMIGLQDTNNYYALDTLDFAVELVRSSDSLRIALIDTIGILPNPEPGRPRMYGMRPLMALVRYPVPPEFNNITGFLRVRLYNRGNGKYWFTRFDGVTVGVSGWLNDTDMTHYTSLFNPGLAKHSLRELNDAELAEKSSLLDVAYVQGSRDQVVIAFDSSPDGTSTTVSIYDALGNQIFLPFLAASSNGRQQVVHRLQKSGIYFVGLLYGGHLIQTRKITVTK